MPSLKGSQATPKHEDFSSFEYNINYTSFTIPVNWRTFFLSIDLIYSFNSDGLGNEYVENDSDV